MIYPSTRKNRRIADGAAFREDLSCSDADGPHVPSCAAQEIGYCVRRSWLRHWRTSPGRKGDKRCRERCSPTPQRSPYVIDRSRAGRVGRLRSMLGVLQIREDESGSSRASEEVNRGME